MVKCFVVRTMRNGLPCNGEATAMTSFGKPVCEECLKDCVRIEARMNQLAAVYGRPEWRRPYSDALKN